MNESVSDADAAARPVVPFDENFTVTVYVVVAFSARLGTVFHTTSGPILV